MISDLINSGKIAWFVIVPRFIVIFFALFSLLSFQRGVLGILSRKLKTKTRLIPVKASRNISSIVASEGGMMRKAIFGSIVHSKSSQEVEIIEEGAIIFNENTGVIVEELFVGSLEDLKATNIVDADDILNYSGKIIVPGFVDAHCHAPQYVFSGTGMDLPLLLWLEKYTFPCESRFQDNDFARIGFEKSIKRHLKCGTTFSSYFGTLHNSACEILVEVIKEMGQRAYVGKVSMDRNSPDFYIEETSTGCTDAEKFVRYVLSQTEIGTEFLNSVDQASSDNEDMKKIAISPNSVSILVGACESSDDSDDSNNQQMSSHSRNSRKSKSLPASLLDSVNTPLVMPVVTPRFVPTCTSDMMQFLGDLSLKFGLPVQSHMSESMNEIEWVKSLHPDQQSYAEVYEVYNLLHPRAFMAHCCHSSEEEIQVIKRTGCGVVHCANSNFMLSSGIMDVRRFISEGIPVALGTDVAGGYSPSMLDAIRQTLIASQAKSFEHKLVDKINEESQHQITGGEISKSIGYGPISYKEAFYMATVGGAKVLGMGNVIGNFLIGKKVDCLVLDVEAPGSPIDIFEGEGVSEKFQKFLFNGDDRNIDTVFVDGKIVLEGMKFIG